ncbi:beta-1,6-N-acetylglucosaminyltransferase [Salegentibacter sp. F188]|uniref:Peptide O-xylosyltransferase n=1 Tax=Autumnicola patrickiae TaxID=3075591 RepID=A0ABU3DY13_9FLAO|nr:beta-1,6-N-acetylglucosaminyltransferase [Salegentibacter sp. F188]MDT0688611.1 beta-1,6-N-acetylglucosaminyltransferase [Salegentibacter sp. F188]
MKIAYLITAFGNYHHLRRLLKALSDETKPSFYLHIDKKSPLPENLNDIENLFFIKRRKVWWGGWSHLDAILSLMKEASKSSFDYYVLLSGADYPIRPNSFLYKKLQEGGEYINIIEGFQSHKPEKRIKYYYFDCFDRRDLYSYKTKLFLTLENSMRKVFIKKKYPFDKIYHGSTWWALSHFSVQYILKVIESNSLLIRFFKTSWCPEESLIPTILGNAPLNLKFKNNLTYTDWNCYPPPAIINKNHLDLFSKEHSFTSVYGNYHPFFARKFNDDSNEVIREIDLKLR